MRKEIFSWSLWFKKILKITLKPCSRVNSQEFYEVIFCFEFLKKYNLTDGKFSELYSTLESWIFLMCDAGRVSKLKRHQGPYHRIKGKPGSQGIKVSQKKLNPVASRIMGWFISYDYSVGTVTFEWFKEIEKSDPEKAKDLLKGILESYDNRNEQYYIACAKIALHYNRELVLLCAFLCRCRVYRVHSKGYIVDFSVNDSTRLSEERAAILFDTLSKGQHIIEISLKSIGKSVTILAISYGGVVSSVNKTGSFAELMADFVTEHSQEVESILTCKGYFS